MVDIELHITKWNVDYSSALLYCQLGLVLTKLHRFVEYIPKKCFNSFLQSVVDAKRQGDENPFSSIVVETNKLLSKSCYGYQIVEHTWHNVTKYFSDKKTHAAFNSKQFEKLDHMNNSLYETELAQAQI